MGSYLTPCKSSQLLELYDTVKTRLACCGAIDQNQPSVTNLESHWLSTVTSVRHVSLYLESFRKDMADDGRSQI
ncbi:hypothetical protein C0J52_25844 [Blattella germanica]|nr:hypothetical protein C0J52_25844 [Blattella germanica]